jgi:hypothetical protein
MRLSFSTPTIGMEVGMLKVPYHVGESPTVVLYTTYINRHVGTPSKTKTKNTMSLDIAQFGYLHWV